MCGIFVSVRRADSVSSEVAPFTDLSQKLKVANTARGPDAQNTHRTLISGSSVDQPTPLLLELFASELRLRGEITVVQPHEAGGDVLCWNGEIFSGMDISPHENDGIKLFEKLRSLETIEEIRDLFATIEGPYAFVYYHSTLQCLFFARDPLGRRSLLIHKDTSSPYLLLASVSAGVDSRYDFDELGTSNIYCLSLSTLSTRRPTEGEFSSQLVFLPRSPLTQTHPSPMLYAQPSRVTSDLPPIDFPLLKSLDQIPEHLTEAVVNLIFHLDKSVMLRVQDIPRSSRIAKGQARVAILFSGGIDSTILAFLAHSHVPIDEPIDLLNVAFENPRKIWLQESGNPGGMPKRAKKQTARNGHMEPRISTSYMVPDRVTGLDEVEELRALCPGRVWNFVEVDVPYNESQASRPIIEALMLPGRTVMDMSLGLALYFASKGIGKVRSSPESEPKPYTSAAQVLLNGLGSDELLGGYGRHRSAFNTGGWQSVIEELQLELDRIPTRNLGRDDRIISSHGKETRHPFLSLTVVNFLATLPVHYKMDLRLEVGLGDKMLLRLAARRVGLIEASGRKKRAMQFGSHSARMEGERRGDTLLD